MKSSTNNEVIPGQDCVQQLKSPLSSTVTLAAYVVQMVGEGLQGVFFLLLLLALLVFLLDRRLYSAQPKDRDVRTVEGPSSGGWAD